MNCFNKDYSNFYDLIYKDKKYNDEISSVKRIIRKYSKNSKDLLEFGCGTGNHSNLLSKLNLNVLGIDMSPYMLKIAKKKYGKNKKLKFLKSDINKLKIKKKFDIVSALFHILSYRIKEGDIKKFFLNSNKHLKKDGVLIFDFWYKPAVLYLKPEKKVKFSSDNKNEVYRVTHPQWYKSKDIIDITYELLIFNKKSKKARMVKEIHKMKYFDMKIIKKYLKKYGFKLLKSLEIISNKKISRRTWGALVVAKKI
tara:strand:- start:177 stop:935 length:759 start_codon:yes stop_codon:yes gene_type:complete